jgi:hypothetical protein
MKRKRTETCFIIFVSLYLIEIENGIGNPGNEYETEILGYEYITDT